MREMWFCKGLRGGSLGDLSPRILTGRMEKNGDRPYGNQIVRVIFESCKWMREKKKRQLLWKREF